MISAREFFEDYVTEIDRKMSRFDSMIAEISQSGGSSDAMGSVLDQCRRMREAWSLLKAKTFVAMAMLPAAEEQALRLKYYENRTDDEITAVMRVSRSTVGRYVRNGLDKISVPYETAELIESLSSAEHDRE